MNSVSMVSNCFCHCAIGTRNRENSPFQPSMSHFQNLSVYGYDICVVPLYIAYAHISPLSAKVKNYAT